MNVGLISHLCKRLQMYTEITYKIKQKSLFQMNSNTHSIIVTSWLTEYNSNWFLSSAFCICIKHLFLRKKYLSLLISFNHSFQSFFSYCVIQCDKNLSGERERQRIVTGFARYERTFHAGFLHGCRPNSSLCNRGKLRGGASAAPVTGSTYRSRDSLANARSDYRGELIATDREMHWRRCGAQPSVVAFLLRWSRRRKSVSGDMHSSRRFHHWHSIHNNLFYETKIQ